RQEKADRPPPVAIAVRIMEGWPMDRPEIGRPAGAGAMRRPRLLRFRRADRAAGAAGPRRLDFRPARPWRLDLGPSRPRWADGLRRGRSHRPFHAGRGP